MEIRIKTGGAIHRLSGETAGAIKEGVRSHSDYPELADRLESALGDEVHDPLTLTQSEAVTLARFVDLQCGIERPDLADLRALYWALIGHMPGA